MPARSSAPAKIRQVPAPWTVTPRPPVAALLIASRVCWANALSKAAAKRWPLLQARVPDSGPVTVSVKVWPSTDHAETLPVTLPARAGIPVNSATSTAAAHAKKALSVLILTLLQACPFGHGASSTEWTERP
jgi:hypothetical protein